MQMTNYYFAWEVRTPYWSNETFIQAKNRMIVDAEDLGCVIRWRKAKGTLGCDPRYHFWEVDDTTEAMMFMMALGDKIDKKSYLGEIK